MGGSSEIHPLPHTTAGTEERWDEGDSNGVGSGGLGVWKAMSGHMGG